MLIGSGAYLFAPFPWNWIWPALFGAYLTLQKKFAPLFLTGLAALYSWALYPKEVNLHDRAYFSIRLLQPYHSPFKKGLMYKGFLYAENQKIPCTVYDSSLASHPKANCDYILDGKLTKRGPFNYLFRATQWTPVPKTWSLAETRFQLKEECRRFLKERLKNPKVSSFLSCLITGDVEERSLRYEFGRLGLQHILAVSGFHFAILIAFCSFFLGFFLPHRAKYGFLLIAINAYFLFVGAVPAVQRSWLMALFYLFGKLIRRPANSLNLLGVALCIELLLDPLVSGEIAFQLSFLSCGGILVLRPLFLDTVDRLFKTHRHQMLTPIAKQGYLLTRFVREGLILSLSVNAAIFPLILFHFHSFPLLSFFYNLFFPFLVSCALFSFLVALTVYFLLPISLFPITDFLTGQLLDLASYPPLALDYKIQVYDFPAWLIPPYLFLLFSIGYKKKDHLTNTPSFQ